MASSSTRLLSAVLLAAAVSLAASPLSATPVIEVHQAWDGVEVPNGNSFAYPNTATGVAISRLFRIDNHGTSTLTISNPTTLVSGSGFFQLETPASSVAPGGSATFRVRFLRQTPGMGFGQVTINNNSAQNPYVIHLVASAGTFAPPAQSLFTLTTAERNVWTPPGSIQYHPPPACEVYWPNPDDPENPIDYWKGFTGPPQKYLWESFCFGQAQAGTLHPTNGTPSSWYDPNGSGSQNHAILWLGASALGNALRGNAADYDLAAAKAIEVLKLGLEPTGQGHMRHEAVGGYSGFWEGGVAAMALAGKYQPQGATRGAELLAAARNWWRDHVSVLRQLRMTDGQVALVGARLSGLQGKVDHQPSMSAAVNLQLIDPKTYSSLHPWLQSMLTSSHQPSTGFSGPFGQVNWRIPGDVSARWIVLRAVQLGAIEPVAASHPVRCLSHHTGAGQPAHVYRWTASGRTHTALPWVYGYYGVRWHVSWGPVSPHPGSVLRVEAGTEGDSGKGPHQSPSTIPGTAQLIIPGC